MSNPHFICRSTKKSFPCSVELLGKEIKCPVCGNLHLVHGQESPPEEQKETADVDPLISRNSDKTIKKNIEVDQPGRKFSLLAIVASLLSIFGFIFPLWIVLFILMMHFEAITQIVMNDDSYKGLWISFLGLGILVVYLIVAVVVIM
jgi:hypothetical protein